MTSLSETAKEEATVAPTSGENEMLKEERHEDPMDTSEEKSKTVEDVTVPQRGLCLEAKFSANFETYFRNAIFLRHGRYLDCQRHVRLVSTGPLTRGHLVLYSTGLDWSLSFKDFLVREQNIPKC